MANEENLIPLNKRSKEAAKVIQKKGGDARGRQLKQEKTMREIAKQLMNAEIKTKSGKPVSFKEALFTKLRNHAFETLDLNTIKYLVELLGEGPAQQIDITTAGEAIMDNRKELLAAISRLQQGRKK